MEDGAQREGRSRGFAWRLVNACQRMRTCAAGVLTALRDRGAALFRHPPKGRRFCDARAWPVSTGHALAISATPMLIRSKRLSLMKPLLVALGAARGVTHHGQFEPKRTQTFAHRRALRAGRRRFGRASARSASGGGSHSRATRPARRSGARTGVARRAGAAKAGYFRHPRIVPRDGVGLRGVFGAFARAVVRNGSEAAGR